MNDFKYATALVGCVSVAYTLGKATGKDEEKTNSKRAQLQQSIDHADARIEQLKATIDQGRRALGQMGTHLDRNNILELGDGCKILTFIGKLGVGKSTLCNRMLFDDSKYGNNGTFEAKISAQGVTTRPHGDSINIRINNRCINYFIVDTPGAYDPHKENQLLYENSIGEYFEYFNACGGINAFCIVHNGTNTRLDSPLIDLLRRYEKFYCTSSRAKSAAPTLSEMKQKRRRNKLRSLNAYDMMNIDSNNGNNNINKNNNVDEKLRELFWKHVIIAFTHIDQSLDDMDWDDKKEYQLNCHVFRQGLINEMKLQDFVNDNKTDDNSNSNSNFNNNPSEDDFLPIFSFGRNNFRDSRKRMYNLLAKNKTFRTKYVCDRVYTPIIEWKKELKQWKKKKKAAMDELNDVDIN